MSFTSGDPAGGEGLFPQHPKVGEFETLKGGMVSPPLQMPLESSAMGDSRHIDSAGGTDWTGSILVNTGMTRAGGTLAH